VTSDDGMDEISISGHTQLSEARDGMVVTRRISPEEFGLKRSAADAISGGDAETNARMIARVLEGEKGAHRDIVLANAAAALTVAGISSDFIEGIEVASQSIDSGAAQRTLSALRDFTHRAQL
jgi:anthranilate phosphoribosyltransferase